MRFLIVGQGSIGSMIGARLKLKNNDVFFVVRNPIRLNIIKREGIVIFEKDYNKQVKCDGVYLFDKANSLPETDFVVVATKSYDAVNAVSKIKDMVPDSAEFITLQNGITPHIEVSKIIGEKRHIIMSLYDSAFSFSLNQVRLTGRGKNIITSFDPSRDLSHVEKTFKHAGFDVEVDKDAFSILYRKLFINAVINPITTILRVKNGELIRNKYASDLARGVLSEIEQIALALNLKDRDTLETLIFKTVEKTADNKSSMLQDVEWKRQTEIDDILGYTLHLADEYKIKTPKLKDIYLIVKALESQYLK